MLAELDDYGYEVHGCDLIDGDDVLDLVRRPADRYDLVIHAAARSPHRAAIDGDPAMHAYNMMLDSAMFDWAVRTRQKRLVYLSSCAAADGPVDDYARTKLAGEWLAGTARAAGLPVTVVRPYSGYGSDQSPDFPFRAMAERARRRDDPFDIWGDGTQVRDWIHIDDLVRATLAVAESDTGETVHLCSGIGTSVRQLAELFCTAEGYQPEFRLRTDKPAGVRVRIGDPTVMHQYYTPQIDIETGVKLALSD
jgi:nucleoside-diphosphate-sugar epimerase